MRTIGAWRSRVTSTEEAPVRPFDLVPTATIMLTPSRRGIATEKKLPARAAMNPLTCTCVMPADTVPWTTA